jgi:hypothetical protein
MLAVYCKSPPEQVLVSSGVSSVERRDDAERFQVRDAAAHLIDLVLTIAAPRIPRSGRLEA